MLISVSLADLAGDEYLRTREEFMRVFFAAVQERNMWRVHCGHGSLEAATTGRDGAENLILGIGRVGKEMTEKYGQVYAVLVWRDDMAKASALRLAPGGGVEFQRATVSISLLENFTAEVGPSFKQIDKWFSARPVLTNELHPEEFKEGVQYHEGSVTKVYVNAYERNAAARQACINHHGLNCSACGINFEDVYGDIGRGFIHVHHEVSLSSIGAEYQVDPIHDLKPVCPNCHAMLHRAGDLLSLEELKIMLGR